MQAWTPEPTHDGSAAVLDAVIGGLRVWEDRGQGGDELVVLLAKGGQGKHALGVHVVCWRAQTPPPVCRGEPEVVCSIGAVPVGEVLLDVLQRRVHEVREAVGEVEVHSCGVDAALAGQVAVEVNALHAQLQVCDAASSTDGSNTISARQCALSMPGRSLL